MKLYDLVLLLIVVVMSLFLRLWRLEYPPAMYFDEVYHVPAAMLLAHGDARTPFDPFATSYDGVNYMDWLHPPLAKYVQALSMQWFGFTPFGWRLPSVVFGTASLIVLYFWLLALGEHYLFARQKMPTRTLSTRIFALMAVFLFSLDGIFLTMSRIAMNDVVLLFFSLLSVLIFTLYLIRKNQFWLLPTGFCLGLAVATKWSAGWILLLLLLYELGRARSWKYVPLVFFSLLLLPIVVYVLSYSGAFHQGLSLAEWLRYQWLIVQSQLQNEAWHAYSSDPLTWPLNWRSVWLWTSSAEMSAANTANIYVLANPLLSIYALVALVMTLRVLLQQRLAQLPTQGLYFLLLLYLASFLPWILFSRNMFLHHYLLAVPFAMAMVSYWLVMIWQAQTLQKRRVALIFNLLFWACWLFVLFYPHWVGLPVPMEFANAVYFLLPSWR